LAINDQTSVFAFLRGDCIPVAPAASSGRNQFSILPQPSAATEDEVWGPPQPSMLHLGMPASRWQRERP